MDTLKDRVEAFAELRKQETQVKKTLQDAEARFREQHVHLIEAARVATELRTQLEQVIRDEARMEFLATGDKNPAPGVSIRLNKRLQYDEASATSWAFRNALSCLTLNKKAFEEAAQAKDLPFVEVVTDPTVAISTNLFGAFQDAVERETEARAAG
jgi:hypothetical protein